MGKSEVVDRETGEVFERARPLRTAERKAVRLHFNEPTRAHQAFKAECDINNIVKSYQRSGVFTHVRRGSPAYLDTVGHGDFHAAMNIVLAAEAAFAELPAAVRKRFGNDPGAFVDFASDPANLDELRKLGLAPPPEPEAEDVSDVDAGQDGPSPPAVPSPPLQSPPKGS